MAPGEYISVLRNEFVAGEGSFLIQMRVDLVWDKAAFSRLTAAMLDCCKAYARDQRGADDETSLPVWLAEGFWYLSFCVRDWTTHPAWAARTAPEQGYYDDAYERLDALASWFFTGAPLYSDIEKGYAPM